MSYNRSLCLTPQKIWSFHRGTKIAFINMKSIDFYFLISVFTGLCAFCSQLEGTRKEMHFLHFLKQYDLLLSSGAIMTRDTRPYELYFNKAFFGDKALNSLFRFPLDV